MATLCNFSGETGDGLFSVGLCFSGTYPPQGVVTRMTSMIRFPRPKGNFAGITRGGGGGGKEGRGVKLGNDFLLSRFERVG